MIKTASLTQLNKHMVTMDKSILYIVVSTFILCVTGVPHFDTTSANVNIIAIDDSRIEYKVTNNNLVKVDLFYESLCPDCIADYPQFPPVVKKLHNYINLQTYPYGNAKMYEDNGKTIVKCQHGERECYGNKLHACAIDQLKDVQKYVDFNACMMAKRSDDDAADECGELYKVDANAIKTCAKGARGHELLVYYGRESEKINYNYVPYVLVDGQVKDDDKPLLDAVCESIHPPPKECDE
ncbi:GILT-like protein 2 [Pectinophora gossypiella]|uniref:GILT-like protein 2 n=1 Tax=Pectinophora gossypiella TaxID=13191 RepID=UPI00214ED417|nr:GILT-like protein 2 [Pectinophora gossypiella]